MEIRFDTNELTKTDAAVLRALVNSLDPEWPAEDTPEKAPRRRPGRPRKAAAEQAETRAKNADAVATPEPDQPAEETPAEPAAPAAPRKAAPAPKPEPEPEPQEPEDDDQDLLADDEDPMDKAVRLATELVQEGRGTEVRGVLKELGAKRVSDLKGDSLASFIKSASEM